MVAAESAWEEEEEEEEEAEGCVCEVSLSFEGGKKPESSSSWQDLGYHRRRV